MREFGIIGGTGKQGNALASRLLRAGYSVRIGSRSEARGKEAANKLQEQFPKSTIDGGNNEFAAEAQIVVIAIPIDQVVPLLKPLAQIIGNKIVFDMTVNLTFGKIITTSEINGLSSMEHIRQVLPDARVVTTLKTISFLLLKGDHSIDQTDFEITESDEAYQISSEVARSIGLTPLRIPHIEYAKTLESMVALGIQLNKMYKGSHAGYKITNLNHNT